MKVALLAGASSIHTIRWANGLVEAGLDVHLITQHPLLEPVDDRVAVEKLPYRGAAGYFLMVPKVKELLRRIRPDILSVHYASGYATTARLVGFRPWVLSIWGSDVYDFPERSLVHRWWVRKNLMAADSVASTSLCMAAQARRIAPDLREVAITPFGVNVDEFSRASPSLAERGGQKPLVVGTVKVLAKKYGVDLLIRAFARVRQQMGALERPERDSIRLRIVGDGPDREALERLARELEIDGSTEFVGRVPHSRVPFELAVFDVYVALSRLDSESFGVAVIEAGAARRPVVVSDAGGLPEVVKAGETGLVVPREDVESAAQAILQLILDKKSRVAMGEAGLDHVSRKFSWSTSVDKMVDLLEDVRSKFAEGSEERTQ